MPKTVAKALGKNHYDFVNTLLDRKPPISKDTKLVGDDKAALMTELGIREAELKTNTARNQEQEETFQKLQRT